ncbi:nucleoside diphosphate-linked moiety X motif 6 isoform X2 [Neocloeon triangulifer]|uniref:nucleoside diphosphate-linked moiety X motif 6 isoform X2 n=1 Tax=Neocloeon triangulifer TaxID=2078957 RepID=UPI00286F3625|nr:nucleoside diphosphate-linked moiety X motif 6 isoform X2 [Neocloeon triangulifer]
MHLQLPVRLLLGNLETLQSHRTAHLIRKAFFSSTTRLNLFCTLRMAQNTSIIFQGQLDRYNGITIDSTKEICQSTESFTEKLKASLNFWIEQREIRGVWFQVALKNADWVPILAQHEFCFHHAKPEAVTMCRWLPKNEPCNIPSYAHTMVGVGGLVVDSKNRLLVVKERFWQTPSWKLPGGFLESGEDMGSAAIREVFEETGILTEFNSIVALRHHHASQFGCSDIYIIVHLSPMVEDQPIQQCNQEITECCWMKIEEFLVHPEAHDHNRFFVRKYLENAKRGTAMTASKSKHPIFKNTQTIYTINCESSV